MAGGSYTSNSGVTLYAVWKLAAVAPTISSATFNRCTENGEINAEGTYIKAVIAWAVDTKVITSNAGKVINITWSPATGDISSKSVTVTGTSGTVTQILGSADFDPSTVYTFNSSITDTVGLTTSSGSRIVASVFHTFDIGNKGKSIGLGAVASDSSNSLTVGFDSTIINNDNVIINGESLKDFVKEFGTSTTTDSLWGRTWEWRWIKTYSGKCFAWGECGFHIGCTTAWGSGYYDHVCPVYPFKLSKWNVQASASFIGGGIGHTGIYDDTATQCPIYIWSAVYQNTGTMYVKVFVEGVLA